MFHAPTSENKQKTDLARNQLTTDREQTLSPQVTAIPGYAWLDGASSGLGSASLRRPHGQLARLHSVYGNQAVLRMLSHSKPAIQTKLAVNQPGDLFEQEADRVADHVMRMTAVPTVQRTCSSCKDEDKLQRKCAECEEEEKETALLRKETNAGPQVAPPSVHDVLNSPGQPLDPATRAFMEPRFGHDFSAVRVHTNERAANSASEINALAYTTGNNIVFGAAQHNPSSASGRRLLAHELTHVLQQGSPNTPRVVRRQNSPTEEDKPATDTASTSITDMLRDAADRATSTVSSVGASLASLIPSLPPPCKPATSLLMARTLHAFVSGSFIPFARGMFGPQTASLWAEYLDTSLGLPRPPRTFAGPGEIVNGFTKHHKSAEAEQEIIDASVIALGGPAASSMPAPGSTNIVPVASLVGAATLAVRINNGTDPMGLDYDSPATTIPGNIAGGIGSGGPPGNTVFDPDTRGVDGAMQLDLDASGTSLTVRPLLTFHVHDTVDFCPGALGGRLARVETVPMSILEGTEARFGPVFAADVPYDVSYPGPGVSKTVAAPPPPPGPVPPTPPTPPPTPTPPTPTPTPTPVPVPPSQGVTPSAPSDLPCKVSTDFGITGDKVKFRIGNAIVGTSAQTAAIRAFVSRWKLAGSSDDVRVDGYASVDGPNDLNWRLSCGRALSVASALASDIPSGKITTRAHGPTDEFSPSDPTEDRVAVISSTVSPTPPGPTPPGPTPPGPTPPSPVPPTPPGPSASGGVTLKAMKFLSDHHFMKDNQTDFKNTGTVFPKPEWEPTNAGSRSAPISQDKDSNVVVQLAFDATTGKPAGVPFTLIGQSSAGFLTFKASGTLQDGPNQTIALSSVSTTPDAIKAFRGQAINWSIQLPSGRQPLGTVQGLDVFVTMAPPRLPDEVTYHRMSTAVKLTGEIHTLDPQELVQGIMRKFGAYNLDVQYDNAWDMANNIALGAQCIDIVRFVMGLIQTVGCPGVAEAKLIWAKPTDPNAAVESDYIGGHSLHDFPPHPLHPTWGAALIDANACPNNFEAALKFTFGDTRYYPGGVPLIDAGGRKIIFSSAQQVLEIFQYLAWIESTGINKRWTAQEFLISYSHRRTDKVPFILVCDSGVLP